MLNWLLTNIDLVCTILAGIITIVTLLLGGGKKLKTTSTIVSVWQQLPQLIDMAEKITGLTGAERKEYVMNQLEMAFKSYGVTLKPAEIEATSKLIDELVSLTKSINTHVKIDEEKEKTIDL